MKSLLNPKPCPELNKYESLEEKFNAICEYLKIDKIICVIPDLTGFTYPPTFGSSFYVTNTIGPKTSYIKSIIKEWTYILSESLDKFVLSDMDYVGPITID